MAIRIKYHIPKDRLTGKVKRAWKRTALDLKDKIIETSQDLIAAGPYFDGMLHGSATWFQKDEMTWFVGYTAPHAKPVEFGSRPHWAPPFPVYDWCRRKLGLAGRVLSEMDTDLLFAIAFGRRKAKTPAERAFSAIYKKIGVKGTEAQPFLRPAVEMARPQVSRFYIKNLAKEGIG